MRRRKNQRWLCKGGSVGKEEDLRVSQAGQCRTANLSPAFSFPFLPRSSPGSLKQVTGEKEAYPAQV